ncbi:MAG: putative metal-binding motif-containing protein [Myxococcota bacterium]
MRLALISLLLMSFAGGCGDDGDKSGDDTSNETDADSDTDADADSDADADVDADVDIDSDDTGEPAGTDDDGDGITVEDGDCDDTNDTIYPGATEVVDDGIDQDCNGLDTVTCPEESSDFPVGERRDELLACVVEEGGCDLIIEPNSDNQILLQGSGYWADDGLDHSGELVCIPSGNYSHLNFSGLRGTAEAPVTITNCGEGQVVVDAEGAYPALNAHAAQHLHLTGTGDPAQPFGFVVKNPGPGLAVVDMKDGTSDIELDRFEVMGPAYSGIAIRTYPYCDPTLGRDEFTQYNTRIHHNYVHDVSGEGLYLGPSHYHSDTSPTSTEDCAPGIPEAALRGVEVHHNTVEDVGRDGIQVGAAIEGMFIYNNVIRRYALADSYGHIGGIQINPGSVGEIFGNRIESAVDGPLDNAFQYAGGEDGPTYLYNNLIVGTQTPFIALNRMGNETSPVYFLNNTVVSRRSEHSKTMALFCSDTWVRDFVITNNIFTNYDLIGSYKWGDEEIGIRTSLIGSDFAENCLINGLVYGNDLDENQKIEGNLYLQEPEDVGFVDFSGGDFHLTEDSEAVDAGEDLSDFLNTDMDGTERRFGPFDMGAYEWTESDAVGNTEDESSPEDVCEEPI